MPNFEILKCLKPIHHYYKPCSALLSKHKGHFLAPEARKTQKMTKTFKKL